MKFSPKKAVSATAITAVIAVTSNSLIATPAHASSVSESGQFLKENWHIIVSNLWSPWFKQVFMTNLSPQETQDVANQYRSRAGGVLHDRCVNKTADMYLGNDGWLLKNTTNRWVVASTRVENGQANCYIRLHNRIADEFIRRRGW
jgi:hypothetical protein